MDKLEDFKSDVYGNSFHYLNNPKIKRANITLPYTEEHIREIIRCKEDIYHFASNHYKLVHQDYGLIPIEIRDYQVRMVDSLANNRFSINLASRQCLFEDEEILIRTLERAELIKIKDVPEHHFSIPSYNCETGKIENDKGFKVVDDKKQCIEVSFSDYSVVKCSVEHPFIDKNNEESVAEIGKEILKYEGGEIKKVEITNIKEIGEKRVINLHVLKNHTYISGNGIISHNCGKCVDGNTKIKVRNKETGEIKKTSISNFYKFLKTNETL